jgi:hypothetical protein
VITRRAEDLAPLLVDDAVAAQLQEIDLRATALRTRLEDLEATRRYDAPTEAPSGAPCIQGVVVDEEGNPVVTGGRIKILPAGGTVEGGPGVTSFNLPASKHEFRSPALAPGHRYDVTALYFAGFVGTRAEAVAPDGGVVRLILTRGRSIEGRVLEEDGTPVRGRVVVIARATPAPNRDASYVGGDSATAVVRADGSYQLHGLLGHPFHLRVSGEDYLDGAGSGPHHPGNRVDIRVTRGVALLGRVQEWTPDDFGRFLLFAVQEGRTRRLVTVAPGGSFEARALHPGPARLEIAPAATPARRFDLGTFDAPASSVEVRVPPEAREAAAER